MGQLHVLVEYCSSCGFYEQRFDELAKAIRSAFPYATCEAFPGRLHAFEVTVYMDRNREHYLAASKLASGAFVAADLLLAQLQEFMAYGTPAATWTIEED